MIKSRMWLWELVNQSEMEVKVIDFNEVRELKG